MLCSLFVHSCLIPFYIFHLTFWNLLLPDLLFYSNSCFLILILICLFMCLYSWFCTLTLMSIEVSTHGIKDIQYSLLSPIWKSSLTDISDTLLWLLSNRMNCQTSEPVNFHNLWNTRAKHWYTIWEDTAISWGQVPTCTCTQPSEFILWPPA